MIKQAVPFVSAGAQQIHDTIVAQLDSFISSFDHAMNDAIQSAGSVTIGGYEESHAGTDEDLDQGMANNFVLAECINHDVPGISAFFVGTADDDPVTVFLTTLSDVATEIQDSGTSYDAAVDFFSGLASDRDSIFSTPVSQFYKIMQNLADIALPTLRKIVDEFFEIIATALESLQDMLNASWNIPFVSKFYKWMFSTDLTALDLIALIAAIPATVTYKIKYGQAPFPTDADEAAFENAYSLAWLLQQFGFGATAATEASTSSTDLSSNQVFGILFGVTNGLSGILTTWQDAQGLKYKASTSVTALGLGLSIAAVLTSNPYYWSNEEDDTLRAEARHYLAQLIIFGVAGAFLGVAGVKGYRRMGLPTETINTILSIVMSVGGCVLLVTAIQSTKQTSIATKRYWYMASPWPMMFKFLKLIPGPYAKAVLCSIDGLSYLYTTTFGTITIIES
jgi:hypothetical protein